TTTSGPGLSLKTEAIGLAIMTELPIVIINVQRGGPSTSLPTKTEQSDLLQAMFGRNGESPLPILAPKSPSDCFDIMIQAIRIAITYMTPTMILSDGYLGNSSDPWLIPKLSNYPKISVNHPESSDEEFLPYKRNEYLARPWLIPGTKNLEHQIGGLEKQVDTGAVSYDAENHQKMTNLRAEKIQRIAFDIPRLEVTGPKTGDLLVLGWGSTFGAIFSSVKSLQSQGYNTIASAHLRFLNPFPSNLKEVLHSYKKVLIPEINMGQLKLLIKGTFLIDAIGLNKVEGKPFVVRDIELKIIEIMSEL
ncbi:MAG: 2-oxoglutarate ferredoxin oxidoreductase subunit alpha, partial [Candidatus Heimdallarchaeota archaeon]